LKIFIWLFQPILIRNSYNIKNQAIYSPSSKNENDVANGEIGIVEGFGFYKGRSYHRIRFTSQPDIDYSYSSQITDSEYDSLELSYALTVHKAQGSGFDSTILIINEPPSGANAFISRELIYTALTRQSEKVYILYNKEPHELKKHSYAQCSDLAVRLTNLFCIITISRYKGRFYAENLIHVTKDGNLVRSKSEVIIYNELLDAKINFKYEEGVAIKGKLFSPDFTIYLPDGKVKYWEHLGMLSNKKYADDWERKKAGYETGETSEDFGNLIITKDNRNGGIDSKRIAEIVNELYKLMP